MTAVRRSAAEPAEPAEPAAPTRRGTRAQRFRVGLIELGAQVLRRLPERAIDGLAIAVGAVLYRARPGKAAQARRNLGRVVSHLTATGRASPEVAAAARDPRALERLVRRSFRHVVQYYLEVARTPLLDDQEVLDQLTVDAPDEVDAVFAAGRPVAFLGLHFGAIELSARFLAIRTPYEAVAPMETLADPELQAWMYRSRGRVGIRIVGLREARRELLAALRRGESVGLVADRDITGGGIEVPFFGASAPLPAGPGLLVLEADAPIYVSAVRRLGRGRYRGRVIPITAPVDGTRRERLTAVLLQMAAAFESMVADAPEQWWAAFFPIWPDLEATA